MVEYISVMCAPLKYHMARLGRPTGQSIEKMISVDGIVMVLQIVTGVVVETASRLCGSPIDKEPYYRPDRLQLVFGLFLFFQALLCWPLTVIVHSSWIYREVSKQDVGEKSATGHSFALMEE